MRPTSRGRPSRPPSSTTAERPRPASRAATSTSRSSGPASGPARRPRAASPTAYDARAMTDDFRIWITVDGDGVVGELLEGLRTGDAARDVEGKLGERVVVSHADDQLFLYTATHEDAEAAAAAVRPAIEHHKLRVVEQRLQRWHPEAEVWEDAERPLPATEEEREAEHAHLQAVEAAE